MQDDWENVKLEVDNLDIDKLKNVTSRLDSLISELDKLNTGKLETTPIDLEKLSDAVKNEVVKKTVYDELVKKVNADQTIDTSDLFKRAGYNTKIKQIGNNKQVWAPDFSPFAPNLSLPPKKNVSKFWVQQSLDIMVS